MYVRTTPIIPVRVMNSTSRITDTDWDGVDDRDDCNMINPYEHYLLRREPSYKDVYRQKYYRYDPRIRAKAEKAALAKKVHAKRLQQITREKQKIKQKAKIKKEREKEKQDPKRRRRHVYKAKTVSSYAVQPKTPWRR